MVSRVGNKACLINKSPKHTTDDCCKDYHRHVFAFGPLDVFAPNTFCHHILEVSKIPNPFSYLFCPL